MEYLRDLIKEKEGVEKDGKDLLNNLLSQGEIFSPKLLALLLTVRYFRDSQSSERWPASWERCQIA